ncbi:helix-turn-helix transcriptional regulator [Nocardia sp. 852002-51101_SCH5132738]|uniref:helix-turn-helix domain-containing protein n=1 Tax=Nocardia sp. 852002-51101_SCH5132738 TaxID=1834095 RepID=UPI000A7D8FEE|nr:helix-turn-helix transcriptional regulator [Nocardia sp. 852002-51101_SCH5132738]
MVLHTSRTPITDGSGLDGRVSGAVLATIRREIGHSQESLAEHLGSSVRTVQAWEQGTNPLINLRYAKLRQLQRTLLAGGATAELVGSLDTALAADDILSGLDRDDPQRHPLGLTVPDRATTDMLAWPLTGTVPRGLAGTDARLSIPAGQRAEVVAGLRVLAETAGDGEAGAMLRRQAVFLVAEHDAAHGPAEGWAGTQIRTAVAATDLSRWSPEWAVARSAAIRAASGGDPEPLRRFAAEGLADPENEAANLRYWAYWVGEMPVAWSSDAEMIRPGTDATWTGELLLRSLLTGVRSAPYRELCAHSLWSLARARKQLVTHPRWVSDISDTVEAATTDETLSDSARRRLEQVHFLLGSTL